MTNSITRNVVRKNLRAHVVNENGRPLCGGGFLARLETAWQTDLAEPNCQRCLAIQAKRLLKLTPPPNHDFLFEI
jgi:hypothetical protein